MKAFLKSIIAGCCAISIAFSCVVPVFAENEVTSMPVGFWSKYLKWVYDTSSTVGGVPGLFSKLLATGLSRDLCGSSSDGLHHGNLTGRMPTMGGKIMYEAKCNYCGDPFFIEDAQVSDAYTDYVSTLPASGYDSAGTLLWQPRWSDAVYGKGVFGSASQTFNFTTGLSRKYSDFARCSASGSCLKFSFSYQSLTNYYCDVLSAKFSCPISGYYRRLDSVHWTCSVLKNPKSGETTDSRYSDSSNWSSEDTGSRSVGETVSVFCPGSSFGHAVALKGGVVDVYTPVFSIVPADQPVITNNYYINTRVNNFNGDYYDSVTNNYYNNTTIINETTNNDYDMTTNTTYVMQKWSYDYQSRTYFITLEDGTTVTVQFGDDCMTITNNNVTNSYQYVIKNTPSTPDTPTTCKHEWTETIDTAPTCLESGHASYTCSKCGETYEQLLAAKGHDWKVIEHVNMVYNSDGTVAAQGHTLYQCSVCGEQWYTDTGAPPPDVSGSSSILAWLQEFKVWLGDKLDNLFSGSGSNNFWTSTKDTVADVLSSLLEALLGFITDILGAILDLVKELLSFFFDLLSSVVISGISGFFSGLKDSRLFDFAQKGEDGSVTALPDGVAAVFAFFSGVLLALPVELRSLLFFGTALVVLIGVINIIRS